MNKTNQKVILITILGICAVLLSVLITPSFAAEYLDSDHNISSIGLRRLGFLRLVSVSFGILAIIYNPLVTRIGPEKMKEVHNWIAGKLQNEKVWVVIILIAGSFIRLLHLPIVGINTPYKLGGLFLEFAHQIASNDFLLPEIIPFYTDGGIPFAYPPLPFYVEAIAVYILGITPYAVVNILPPTVAVLSLISFYYLTREAALSKWSRVTALAAFAFMPNAFEQQIEGAGLAESFGTFALIWFFITLYRAYKSDKLINYAAIGLSWALCIVSSPGSAYASVPIFFLFSIVMFIQQRNFLNLAFHLGMATLLALVISSPYWITVIRNHGVNIFLVSMGGQYEGIRKTIKWILETILQFELITGPFPFIWNLCIFIGLVTSYLKKRYLLVGWFIILILIPRESPWMLSIPSALLIGMFTETLCIINKNAVFPKEIKRDGGVYYGGILLILIWLAIGPLSVVKDSPFSIESSFDVRILDATNWMKINIDPNSKVVVIAESHILEWIPQMSQRTGINIKYGSEWQPNEATYIKRFNNSVKSCKNFDCLLSHSQNILDLNRFILFIEKGKLESMTTDQTERATFDLLWENDLIVIGEVYE